MNKKRLQGDMHLMEPFGYADKPAEKHCLLICCERNTVPAEKPS
jgi:hypothetical protein